MSYISDDRNYTDSDTAGIDPKAERVGEMTGEPPTNKALDRNIASKLANLLEGLDFPASKEKILDHINRKSPSMGNRINDVFEAINNNLETDITYNNTYEVELAAGLVSKSN